ncbi:MAG: hypothetical protein OHK0012_26730 [Synechococcales cyanobacterium]
MEQHLSHIELKTPESVSLSMPLGGIGNRALALMVDYVVLLLILTGYLLLLIVGSPLLVDLLMALDVVTEQIDLWIFAIAGLIYFAIFVGYFVFFETLWQGQTPGKRVAQIRVIQDDGRPVGVSQSVLRGLMRPIDDLSFVGAILIMASPRQKRLGDWLAGTVIVQTRPEGSPPELPGAAQEMMRQVQEMDVHSLILPIHDVSVIRQFLQQVPQMSPVAQTQVSQTLSQQIVSRWETDTSTAQQTLLPLATRDPLLFLQVMYASQPAALVTPRHL